MNSLYLPLLKNITCKKRTDQEHDQNKQSPGAEELLLLWFRRICIPYLSVCSTTFGAIRLFFQKLKENEHTIFRICILCRPAC